MLNRNEMRQAKKVVEMIVQNTPMVRFTLDGIIQYVDSGTWPDNEQLIPLIGEEGTVGAVRARPDWQHDPVIIDHLIASVQGRMLHFSLIEHAKVDPTRCEPMQIAQLLLMTEDQQRKILLAVCGKEKAEAHWKAGDEELKKFAEAAANQGSRKF